MWLGQVQSAPRCTGALRGEGLVEGGGGGRGHAAGGVTSVTLVNPGAPAGVCA